MTGWRLYWELRRWGVRLRSFEGRIQTADPHSADNRAAIRSHRDELVGLIEGLEERAGILEFDASLYRKEAERRAETECRAAFQRGAP
jgi:hypothetical protein